MNYFKPALVLAVIIPCSLASVVKANPLTLGASVIYSQSPYKGGDNRFYPLPVVNYEGDNFYVRSLTAGYYLWKDQQNQLSLTVLGSPQNFDPDDTDDGQLKRLDKRHMTLMGGIAYRHTADWGIVRTVVAADMLDNSNGFLWDLTYLYKFDFDQFSITPGIGALFSSDKQNDYYYGVSSDESRRSGLNRYEADSSWNPYVELTANYSINQNWSASVSGRYILLSDEVKDSPMVDKSSQVALWTGISYTF